MNLLGSQRIIVLRAKAEAYREALMAEFAGDKYWNPNATPTIREVAGHWLEAKRGTIKPQTMKSYKCQVGQCSVVISLGLGPNFRHLSIASHGKQKVDPSHCRFH